MNVFLRELAAAYPNDFILLAADGAAWHKSKGLVIAENIEIIPYPFNTPEMNSIEQIRKELCKRGFKNKVFQILTKVVARLCDTICALHFNCEKHHCPQLHYTMFLFRD